MSIRLTMSRFRIRNAGYALAAGALCVAPAVHAQAPAAPQAPVRMKISVQGNSCRAIQAMPSPLVGSPEGMVLLKMQHELGSITAKMAEHPDSGDFTAEAR